MAYPMEYGYSLVGEVIDCGHAVPVELVGKLAFAFHAHASHAVLPYDQLMMVPEGIPASDAVYLPAVETALSIVHDVHPRYGETVAVFGQGVIGLLVTTVLARSGIDVACFDFLPDRLALAKRVGAASTGRTPPRGASYDVTVEVTGSPRALQSAIDCTKEGGRLVIASWYGASDVNLKLGTAFHRSHIQIVASQVSRIPASLSMRWDKGRRFDVAWELLRAIQPSTTLTTTRVGLHRAGEAFELLVAGKTVVTEIVYDGPNELPAPSKL